MLCVCEGVCVGGGVCGRQWCSLRGPERQRDNDQLFWLAPSPWALVVANETAVERVSEMAPLFGLQRGFVCQHSSGV